MNKRSNRYDAWGNSILPHDQMILYYREDERSLNYVRTFMPHKYICLPTIEIRIDCRDAKNITVFRMYPGKDETEYFSISERALNGLRKTWKGRKGWTRRKSTENFMVLRHQGKIILEPSQKFGWVP